MNFQIFYSRDPSFLETDIPKDFDDFLRRWSFVRELEAFDMEDVFMRSQAEFWTPEFMREHKIDNVYEAINEMNKLLRKAGLHHTSMSVGDIVEDERGNYFIVAGIGFKKLAPFDETEIRLLKGGAYMVGGLVKCTVHHERLNEDGSCSSCLETEATAAAEIREAQYQ